MKRLIRQAVVLGSTMLLVLVVSVGVAFAHPDVSDQGTGRTDTSGNSGGEAVAGNGTANDVNGLAQQPAHNPNCGGHAD